MILNNSRIRSAKGVYSGYIAGIVLVLLVVLGLNRESVRGEVEHFGSGIRRIILGLLDSGNYKDTEESVVDLNKNIAVLEGKIALLLKENEVLRKQLEAQVDPGIDLLPANVIGAGRYIFIDKGRVDGVIVGKGIISEEVFIGSVSELGVRTARVILPTDRDSRLSVVTEKGALGLLVVEDEKLILTKVLQREKLEEGDLVLTSGGELIPRGIVIGRVREIIKKGTEVYRKAEVEPLMDYRGLKLVFVVI